jgi:hypothetical protein
MPPILPRDTPITKDDFHQAGWVAVMNDSSEKTTEAYSEAFFNEAKKAFAAKDLKRTTVFALLGDVTSFVLRRDSVDAPFVRFMSGLASKKKRGQRPFST